MSEFKKYPKIYRLGSEEVDEFMNYDQDKIIIEEKVDGGNGCFWLENNVLHVASRNRDLTEQEDKKTFAKQRATLMKILEGKEIDDRYYYYIEWMAPHTIQYTNTPDVIGLDIRMKRSMEEGMCGLFVTRSKKEKEFERLGIETVPLINITTIQKLRKENVFDLIPQSKYYKGKAEGIVLKNYSRKAKQGNHQLFAKVVAEEFKEDNKAVFGGIKKTITDTMKIVEQFCTRARVNKKINKLVQEDNYPLQMDLMKYLPREVVKDILTEEILNIQSIYNWLDFKNMNKLVTKKCVVYLKEYIDNQ